MRRSYCFTVSLFFLFFVTKLHGQDTLTTAVVIHADPRLSILFKKDHSRDADGASSAPANDITPKPPVIIYSGQGFRVQIYNGPDRNKAMKIKTDFMRHYPNIHSYIS